MKMRDLLALILAFALLAPALAFAGPDDEQDDGDEVYEYKTWKTRRSHAGFNGHGGVTFNSVGFESDDLDQLAADMGIDKLDGMLWGMGGYGLGHIADGWRIGGGGGGMGARSKGIFTDTDGSQYNRSMAVEMGYGGFIVEYSPFMFGPVNVGAGVLLGGGGVNLTLRQDSGTFDWDEIRDPYGNAPSDSLQATTINTTITNGFLLAQPYVTARLHILEWMALEGSVGWFFTTMGTDTWLFGEKELSGPGPEFDLVQPSYRVSLVFGG